MCSQQHKKGRATKFPHLSLSALYSSSAVILCGVLQIQSACGQGDQQETREGANIPPTVQPLKRNKPPILPCGAVQTVQAGDEFFIETPNFNNKMKYPNSAQCEWQLQTDSCSMGINCPDFQLTDFLCFDHMDIINHNGSMNRYCGKKGPKETVLSDNVTIAFTSSAWFPDIGFRCRVVCREAENEQEGPWLKKDVNTTHCYCGLIDQKIVGGEPAKIESFPWLAGLVRRGGFRPFCGGTLINSKYILTAAHCVQGRTPYNLEILFNVTALPGDQGGQEMQVRRSVDNILVHRNFSSRLDFDAALIRLSEPVDISGIAGQEIKPVCLPTEKDMEKLYIGENATVVGWGQTSENGDVSSVLMKTNVEVISNADCSTHYPTITDRMLCAFTPGKDACQGDSGGPLFVVEGEEDPTYVDGISQMYFRYVQIGVISWGQGCGVNPGVYSRLTELMKWISINARDGSYCSNL
ncbi:Venom serine protease 34 [Orchesella cincta]|uniref:Venom serine protease 34 n=1 Tax=Orchesella cincta TaxID=48709 RepID=A0A1D2N1X5_ORCCI|nr:Venom serine protease 34 [Orchesella cincta]